MGLEQLGGKYVQCTEGIPNDVVYKSDPAAMHAVNKQAYFKPLMSY